MWLLPVGVGGWLSVLGARITKIFVVFKLKKRTIIPDIFIVLFYLIPSVLYSVCKCEH